MQDRPFVKKTGTSNAAPPGLKPDWLFIFYQHIARRGLFLPVDEAAGLFSILYAR